MINNCYTLLIEPQSATEFVSTLVRIGGSMKGGARVLSLLSLGVGALTATTINSLKTHKIRKENKVLKEQNKELKEKLLKNNIQGEVNEQKI